MRGYRGGQKKVKETTEENDAEDLAEGEKGEKKLNVCSAQPLTDVRTHQTHQSLLQVSFSS